MTTMTPATPAHDTSAEPAHPAAHVESTRDAHLRLTAALYEGLYDALSVTPAMATPTGSTGGWTLRPDPLNGQALRFDWLTGTIPSFLPSGTAARRAQEVLFLATRIAATAGFRVRRDGTGLYLTPITGL